MGEGIEGERGEIPTKFQKYIVDDLGLRKKDAKV